MNSRLLKLLNWNVQIYGLNWNVQINGLNWNVRIYGLNWNVQIYGSKDELAARKQFSIFNFFEKK